MLYKRLLILRNKSIIYYKHLYENSNELNGMLGKATFRFQRLTRVFDCSSCCLFIKCNSIYLLTTKNMASGICRSEKKYNRSSKAFYRCVSYDPET